MKLRFDLELNQDSYYEASAIRPPTLPALVGSLSCDVCVLGGGLAGLSAALELAQRGYSVVVLESQSVAFGASGRLCVSPHDNGRADRSRDRAQCG